MTAIDISIKVKHYKCFGGELQGFDRICPINLVIGRNNVGKSALLDVIERLFDSTPPLRREPRQENYAVVLQRKLEGSEVQAFVERHAKFTSKPASTTYQSPDTNTQITIAIDDSGEETSRTFEPPIAPLPAHGPGVYVGKYPQKLRAQVALRLAADRDLSPEQDEPLGNRSVAANGRGATNLIQHFVHDEDLPRDLVEDRMLKGLNTIFAADSAEFKRILVQRRTKAGSQNDQEGAWEIFLEEVHKGRVSLSSSGSGLKTIFLVLVLIHLAPLIPLNMKRSTGDCVFLLEELENNLHPSLQRRLAMYLREVAETTGAIFFLTTHSSATIDLFSADPLAQIVHMTHDGRFAQAKTVTTYADRHAILDDLDVRASDLLQTNCVVWVEGPTDRLYFNRWIELWTEGKLREGVHYQCVFYGGRLLSHLSSESPDPLSERGVQLLNVNRHAIAIIDSDKGSLTDELNDSKKRLESEIRSAGGVAWVTAAREIESYLPQQALREYLGDPTAAALGDYESIKDYFAGRNPAIDRSKNDFSRHKSALAEGIRKHLTREELEGRYDLKARLDEAVRYVRRCNRML